MQYPLIEQDYQAWKIKGRGKVIGYARNAGFCSLANFLHTTYRRNFIVQWEGKPESRVYIYYVYENPEEVGFLPEWAVQEMNWVDSGRAFNEPVISE